MGARNRHTHATPSSPEGQGTRGATGDLYRLICCWAPCYRWTAPFVNHGAPEMDRRTFVGTAVYGLFAVSLAANGQPHRKIPRVGVLYFAARDSERMRRIARFRQRLSELGYVDGKTILIDERYADGNAQRLAELAAELT